MQINSYVVCWLCSQLQFIHVATIYFNFSFLLQALCGTTTEIPTLDGRKIPLRCVNIVKPSTSQRIANEGLPIPKQPGRKGDLIIDFDIKFPDSLSSATKDTLSNVLPN